MPSPNLRSNVGNQIQKLNCQLSEELVSPLNINLIKMLTNLSIIITVQHTEERQH